MENIRIGIDAAPAEYAQLLAEKIAKKGSNISSYIFDKDENGTYGGYVPDVILTDLEFEPEAGTEECETLPDIPSVLLTEKRTVSKEEDPHTAYKYGRISDMLRAAMDAFTDSEGKYIHIRGKNRIPVIGTASSSGGSGCSFVSDMMARIIREKYEKNVLVLTLDQFPEGKEQDAGESERRYGMREYLFFMEEGRKEKISAVDMFTYEDGVGAVRFNAGFGPNPLAGADEYMFFRVFENLCVLDCFDVIVFDIGGTACDQQIRAMECCDHLVFVKGRKDEKYMEYMKERMPDFSTYIEIENEAALPCFCSAENRDSRYEDAKELEERKMEETVPDHQKEKRKIPVLTEYGDEYECCMVFEDILGQIMKS